MKGVDSVVTTHVQCLTLLGEEQEVDRTFYRFGRTVADGDARSILYCEMRCRSQWLRGDYQSALSWGRRGQKLKASGVDTKYDPEHSLALTLRDAGEPESALTIFLQGRRLSEVIDPDELDELRAGHHYRNIERCLHFMGQMDSALVCYQKSAILIEREPVRDNVTHTAYARTWIAEVLLARGELDLEYGFLRAACKRWELTSPPRANDVRARYQLLESRRLSLKTIDDAAVEKRTLAWILSRTPDE